MVTFETKVWEKDWEYILKGDYLKKVIENCNYKFSSKHVIINNVKNRNIVEKFCQEKVDEGIIDCFYVIDDYEFEILEHFGLSKDDFKGGFKYSSAELLGIYKCETEYLLHFSGDSFPLDFQQNWIDEAIKIMTNNHDIIVANPTWDGKFGEAKDESFDEIDNFYIGYGFSDQSYLVRKTDFINRIYSEKNMKSERYPKYGGELFEKRVDSYMRNNKKFRITHKTSSYKHTNFPKGFLSRKLLKQQINNQRIDLMEKK
jgi:hypothetical protein